MAVLANDTDADGDGLQATAVAPQFFTSTITDGRGTTATAMVTASSSQLGTGSAIIVRKSSIGSTQARDPQGSRAFFFGWMRPGLEQVAYPNRLRGDETVCPG